jgi:hypothetical protein
MEKTSSTGKAATGKKYKTGGFLESSLKAKNI